jgi:non-ribosomal peptide synthetase component F
MMLLAAFQVLLMRYSNQHDIAVGSPIAGRGRPELEGLIGFFVNTLVMRGDLSGNPTFAALLQQTRDRAIDAYAHQDLPFEKLVEELNPIRDARRNPLFQVMFTLQTAREHALRLRGLDITRIPFFSGTSKFDLTLHVADAQGLLDGAFEYCTDLFDASTIARMGQHFVRLLEGIVDDPQTRIGDLPMMGADERRQLLVAWNDTGSDFPRDSTIAQLFEAQVTRRPDAVALVDGDTALSYSELNARANRLARHLASLGIGPEDPIGICMERSADLVVAMLGILKAGGVYVPLDPGYPAERLGSCCRMSTSGFCSRSESICRTFRSIRPASYASTATRLPSRGTTTPIPRTRRARTRWPTSSTRRARQANRRASWCRIGVWRASSATPTTSRSAPKIGSRRSPIRRSMPRPSRSGARSSTARLSTCCGAK